MDSWEEAYTLSPDHRSKRLAFYDERGDFICNFLILFNNIFNSNCQTDAGSIFNSRFFQEELIF